MSDELCKIDITSLKKRGVCTIGIVLNLDPHDMPGIHWVSMFINLNENKIDYFDSFGDEPPIEVKELIKRLGENNPDLDLQ